MRILILILLFSSNVYAECPQPQPYSGAFCFNGAWYSPPYMSLDSYVVHDGAYLIGPVVYFIPPLVINPNTVPWWKGLILRPNTNAEGSMIILKGDGPMWNLNYHTRFKVEDLYIWGYPRQTCFEVQAYNFTFSNLTANECYIGIKFEWAVNGRVEDSLFTHNVVGAWIKGSLPRETLAITTLHFSSVRFASSLAEGVRISQGHGIVFRDGTIFEANPGVGLNIQPTGPISKVILRDVWFEANGIHKSDPYQTIQVEGGTGTF